MTTSSATNPVSAKSVGIETESYLLPAHWAPVLLNNDESGAKSEDLAAIDAWKASTFPGSCLDADVGNAGFHWTGDDSDEPLGCDRCEFIFATKKDTTH